MISCDWWNIKWNMKNSTNDLYLGVSRFWNICLYHCRNVIGFFFRWLGIANGKWECKAWTYSLYLIAYSNMYLINWWRMISSQLRRLVELILLAFCAWDWEYKLDSPTFGKSSMTIMYRTFIGLHLHGSHQCQKWLRKNGKSRC